jgi:hypothetical protein
MGYPVVKVDVASVERVAGPRSWLADFAKMSAKHGPFVPQAMLAQALGVTRQCVHEWVKRGRIESVEVKGDRFIPLRVAVSFLTESRKVGRPKKKA